MKKSFLFAAMLAIAASCTVSEIDSIKGTAPEIIASYENNGTKTTIITDDEGVGTIWWKPADEINVFYGTLSTHYISKNKENATTVTFGTTDVIGITEDSEQENIWGLYPYDENAVCDGESVTTTIPAIQKAVAGTFDDDLFTSLAHSTSTTMTFYNVLGGIKFSLSRDDIKKITFKGNNDEDIAGKVKLEMDANGKPAAEVSEGEKTITLTPKEGTTFAKNTNYYIVLLPTVLSKGFTMTFETETAIGTFEYTTKSIEIKRSVFSKKENIDSYATFTSKIMHEYVDLGLSVMWGTCNIGANAPDEIGDYFAWGETEPKETYDFSTYKYHGLSNYTYTKYNTISSTPDYKVVLDDEDDAAYVNWGGQWRMPTQAEFEELIEKCEISPTYSENDVLGYEITGPNGNSIFIPCAGMKNGDSEVLGPNDGSGCCLSSSLNYYYDYSGSVNWGHNENRATVLGIFDYYYPEINTVARYWGTVVRPVYVDMSSHNHTFVKYGRQEPGLNPGHKEYYQCVGRHCGHFFEDEDGDILIGDYEALLAWKSKGGEGYLANVPVTDMTFNASSLTLYIGDTQDLQVSYTPENPTYKSVTWESSDPSIVNVSYGTITAQYVGTATIYAKWNGDNNIFASCEVTVADTPVTEPECIDLGLSVKWASFNLGATAPEEYGGYYQWAGTINVERVLNVDYNNCPYCYRNNYSNYWSKYVTTSETSKWVGIASSPDNKTVLDPEDDAAVVKLGGNWRMPTKAEWTELEENCSWVKTTLNGIAGYRVTSKKTEYEDKSIFLPAAGRREGANAHIGYVGEWGYYWTTSRSDYIDNAYYYELQLVNSRCWLSNYSRSVGASIRPVSD